MANASDFLEQQIINNYFRGQATWVGLATANPTDAGGNEVTLVQFPAYARQAADAGGSAGSGWAAPGATNGLTSNSNKLTFPAFNGPAEVQITHWTVMTAASGGNMLTHAPLAEPRTLRTGDRLIFDIGSLTITVA